MTEGARGRSERSRLKAGTAVQLARPINRHFTFVGGVHRCLGAPLARRELWILLEEWFKRIPEFRVKPGADTTVFPGLLSIRNLPLVWDVE